MRKFSVGVLSSNPTAGQELAAALTLLGELVVDAEQADGLFCVDDEQLPPSYRERPLVQCDSSGNIESALLAENDSAQASATRSRTAMISPSPSSVISNVSSAMTARMTSA